MRGIPADAEHSDSTETLLLDRPSMMPMSSGPAVASSAVPRGSAPGFVIPLSGARIRVSEPLPPSGAMQPLPGPRPLSAFLTPWRERPPMPGIRPQPLSKQMRVAITIAALVGLALISFVIALAASRHHQRVGSTPAKTDAAATVVMSELDASVGSAAPVLLVAAPDAGALAAHEATLEVETFPPGGKVKVGDQVRIAPANLVVKAGTFEVIGELAGYQPETRSVTLEPGAHVKVELTFHHKLATAGHPASQMGRLTARTTPSSEVYENGKKLGDTPLADREMTVGPHVLVFKNPLHPAITRRVVISAGKLTKFNERLGD
ncbi:hypothetical protein BH11MYX1_BH11MYX1_42710 [soil metagenome]